MSKTTNLRQQTFDSPAAAANTGVHAAVTLADGATTEVTTQITNPAVPRTIRLKGNQDTTEALEVILEGTDILDQEITETVTMGEAFATPTDSTQAFKTVTKITMPARGGASDTISVGLGAALGLDSFCDAHSFKGQYDVSGTYTFTHDADEISKNTVTLDATLDGSADQAVNYVPATFPAYDRIYG